MDFNTFKKDYVNKKVIFPALLAFSIGAGASFGVTYAVLNHNAKKVQEQHNIVYDDLSAQIDTAQVYLQSLFDAEDSLAAVIDSKDAQLDTVNAHLDSANKELDWYKQFTTVQDSSAKDNVGDSVFVYNPVDFDKGLFPSAGTGYLKAMSAQNDTLPGSTYVAPIDTTLVDLDENLPDSLNAIPAESLFVDNGNILPDSLQEDSSANQADAYNMVTAPAGSGAIHGAGWESMTAKDDSTADSSNTYVSSVPGMMNASTLMILNGALNYEPNIEQLTSDKIVVEAPNTDDYNLSWGSTEGVIRAPTPDYFVKIGQDSRTVITTPEQRTINGIDYLVFAPIAEKEAKEFGYEALGVNLTIDGKVVSQNIATIGDQIYVPIPEGASLDDAGFQVMALDQQEGNNYNIVSSFTGGHLDFNN